MADFEELENRLDNRVHITACGDGDIHHSPDDDCVAAANAIRQLRQERDKAIADRDNAVEGLALAYASGEFDAKKICRAVIAELKEALRALIAFDDGGTSQEINRARALLSRLTKQSDEIQDETQV